MTTRTTTGHIEDLKARQRLTWGSGDYGKIAWATVPVCEALAEEAALRPGSQVLDVATGTGHVALAAARKFCDVTGIDYVPELLATARRRAESEGLIVDFREADAERLPFPDGAFDCVLSALGVMFTADHQRAADEIRRVTRPGGRIGMASWTPAGFVGEMLEIVGQHVAPPSGALPPTRWGAETTVRDLLGDQVSTLRFKTTAVTQRYPSAEFFADFFISHCGPTFMAAERLSREARAMFRADLVTLANKVNLATNGTFVGDWEYLIAIADIG